MLIERKINVYMLDMPLISSWAVIELTWRSWVLNLIDIL
jgi:hypothetical protein